MSMKVTRCEFVHGMTCKEVCEFMSNVVRCRDCNEYNPELYNYITCELLGRYVEPDDFCAWGERRKK